MINNEGILYVSDKRRRYIASFSIFLVYSTFSQTKITKIIVENIMIHRSAYLTIADFSGYTREVILLSEKNGY